MAEDLARPVGLTAARWQVLGAVLREPLTVSGIARAMGITRQSVQRIADLLVEQGLAEYVDNPAHRRAKLVRVTDDGVAAVRRIDPGHAVLAERLRKAMGRERARRTRSLPCRTCPRRSTGSRRRTRRRPPESPDAPVSPDRGRSRSWSAAPKPWRA